MRKRVIVVLAVLLLLMPIRVAALDPVIYDSQEQAISDAREQLEASNYRPGTYPLEIRYHDGDTLISETIHLTMEGPYTVIVGVVAVDGSETMVTTEDVRQFSDADWIRVTDAHAWRLDTLEELSIERINAGGMAAKPGTYAVSFTAAGVTTSVPITVSNSGSATNAGGKNVIFENNISGTSSSNPLPWFSSTNFTILEVSLVSMLIIPVFFLFLQYFWSSRIMNNLRALLHRRNGDKD